MPSTDVRTNEIGARSTSATLFTTKNNASALPTAVSVLPAPEHPGLGQSKVP